MTGQVAASRTGEELRRFLGRLLGWSRERVITAAVESVDLAACHMAELVLCGGGDLVPIARALHRRTLGADRPFVSCDPHRRDPSASVRLPANQVNGVAAFEAALGGTLCLRTRRLPPDLGALIERVRARQEVMVVICASEATEMVSQLRILPAPLVVPPLAMRSGELDRIIAEYAADAMAELAAPADGFTEGDHAWVREHAATSHDEIEKATLRLTAIRTSKWMSEAAARLGMAPPSLQGWLDRRRRPSVRSTSRSRSASAPGRDGSGRADAG